MGNLPDRYGEFWQYLSKTQQDLLLEGQYLSQDVIRHSAYQFTDYSFLIFPFAKAYEGYLKKLFLDADFISHLDYISEHFRLGKYMSPNLKEKLGDRSLYTKIVRVAGVEIADKIWNTWKMGRNQVFHYFSHNQRSVTFQEAEEIINTILVTMQDSYAQLRPYFTKHHINNGHTALEQAVG